MLSGEIKPSYLHKKTRVFLGMRPPLRYESMPQHASALDSAQSSLEASTGIACSLAACLLLAAGGHLLFSV